MELEEKKRKKTSKSNNFLCSLKRRNRDRQIQARIREITTKMMRRRNEGQPNALEEKRQSELELREVRFFRFFFVSFFLSTKCLSLFFKLRKLEAEVKQRRTQINSRFKAYTGDVKSRKKL